MVKTRSILVVFAMDEEMKAFYKDKTFIETKIGFQDIYLSDYKGKTIYGMKCGVGKVSMAFNLGAFLNNIQVDKVFNTGVAGSISEKLKPLSILIANKCAYHDVDLVPFGYKKGQMSRMPLYYDCDKIGVKAAIRKDPENIKVGTILSGDQFITAEKIPSYFYEDFNDPLAVDMESGAVAQCCYMRNIPFQIIRAISDSANNQTEHEEYDRLLNEASAKASKVTQFLIENY